MPTLFSMTIESWEFWIPIGAFSACAGGAPAPHAASPSIVVEAMSVPTTRPRRWRMTTSPLQGFTCDLRPPADLRSELARGRRKRARRAIRHPAAAGIVAPSGKTCHENTKSRRRSATDAFVSRPTRIETLRSTLAQNGRNRRIGTGGILVGQASQRTLHICPKLSSSTTTPRPRPGSSSWTDACRRPSGNSSRRPTAA